jgi:queuine tRNA-ribosyltransferase
LYQLIKKDNASKARAGILNTAHGSVPTPIFMPVGTQGTVKAVSPGDLKNLGAKMILSNTYHLYLRPGADLILEGGGLHKFMNWNGPILTDSGGYQVFSLSELRKINDEGVRFQSHWDGSYHMFTPELVVDIQRNIGSDIMMVLDECVPYPCSYEEALKAHERTIRWADQSLKHFKESRPPLKKEQLIFGIVQGSTYEAIRKQSMEQLINLNFQGYAIGGLAVGEPNSALLEMTDFCTEYLPEDKPRYLMGVGRPVDIIEAVASGVDMFDCVIPTRNGRNGTVYTRNGKLNIRNQIHRNDFHPIDDQCECVCCQNFSRAYMRHLFQADEILGLQMATIHNLHFYMDLTAQIREAILNDSFNVLKKQFYQDYQVDSFN